MEKLWLLETLLPGVLLVGGNCSYFFCLFYFGGLEKLLILKLLVKTSRGCQCLCGKKTSLDQEVPTWNEPSFRVLDVVHLWKGFSKLWD